MVNPKSFLLTLVLSITLCGCSNGGFSAVETIPPSASPYITPSAAPSSALPQSLEPALDQWGLPVESGDTVPSEAPETEPLTFSTAPKALSFLEVWGEVETMIIDTSSQLWPLAISDSGDLLCHRQEPPEAAPKYFTLMIYNIYTQEIVEICSIDEPLQFAYGAINDRWVIYRISSTYDFSGSNCEIYVYDRESGEIRLIYKPPVGEDGFAMGHAARPCLDGDSLLLDEVSALTETSSVITSYEYDLTTGQRQLAAEQFALPQHGDNCLLGLCRYEAPDIDPVLNYSILCRLENDTVTPLMESGASVYDYDSDNRDSVMFTGQTEEVSGPLGNLICSSAWLIENGELILLKKGTPGGMDNCDWPSLSPRIAMWRSEQAAYAYDRVLQKTVRLVEEGNFTAFFAATDRYMMWTCMSQENLENGVGYADELRIVDLSLLPAG